MKEEARNLEQVPNWEKHNTEKNKAQRTAQNLFKEKYKRIYSKLFFFCLVKKREATGVEDVRIQNPGNSKT